MQKPWDQGLEQYANVHNIGRCSTSDSLKEVGGESEEVGLEDFRKGLQVELEHGMRFPDANVTDNHPVLTEKIVLAHLKESLLYYKRLTVAE